MFLVSCLFVRVSWFLPRAFLVRVSSVLRIDSWFFFRVSWFLFLASCFSLRASCSAMCVACCLLFVVCGLFVTYCLLLVVCCVWLFIVGRFYLQLVVRCVVPVAC